MSRLSGKGAVGMMTDKAVDVPAYMPVAPFTSNDEALKAHHAYLGSVQRIQFHGVRTGDGPSEAFVFVEYPSPRDTPTNFVHPARDRELEQDKATTVALSELPNAHFDWGNSGPHSMSLAGVMLESAIAIAGRTDVEVTSDLVARFTGGVVAKLDRHEWVMKLEMVLRWLDACTDLRQQR